MAGQGNTNKGSKENAIAPAPVTAGLYYGSGSLTGLTDLQNRLYVLPSVSASGSPILTGGGATDWFYMAGATLQGFDYQVRGNGGPDWISFESYSYNGALYDGFNGGVFVNLGSAFTQPNGVTVAATAFSSRVDGITTRGTLSSIENAWGSSGNDVIVGTATDNELHGGEGNDRIYGIDGNDLLYGEGGDDVIVGGLGNTGINGGAGNDFIRSSRGNDWIDGGDPGPAGTNRARTLLTDPNASLAAGGLRMQDYGDTVDYNYLAPGWRVELILNGSTWVDATVYDDRNRVRERDKVRNIENIAGSANSEPLTGDSTNNVLDGGGGNDSINAGAGDDLIIGSGGGNDSIDGGAGENDELSFVPILDPVTDGFRYSPSNNKLNDNKALVLDLRLDGGRGRYSFNTVETSAPSNGGPSPNRLLSAAVTTANLAEVDNPWNGAVGGVEHLVGSDRNDQLAGTNSSPTTTGINVINGYDGDDIIYGAGGNDTLIGGVGTDWVMFRDATPGNTPRYLNNPLNTDPVRFEYNDASDPYAGGGIVRLAGAGAGSFNYGASQGGISSVENVLGSTGRDRIVGDSGANVLVGEADIDTVFGGDGADRIYGGGNGGGDIANSNQLWGGAGNDVFLVGFNYNPVVGTANRVTLDGGLTTLLNNSGALPNAADPDYGIVRLAGSDSTGSLDYHDVINDWQAGDTLFLAKGWTAVIGGLGHADGTNYTNRFETSGLISSAYNWSGNDTVDLRSINGTAGNNENSYVVGDNNALIVDTGKIVVSTGAGNDTIYGSNGNDWIFAGTGRNDIHLATLQSDLVTLNSDGADRVYITSFAGQYNVTGFGSEDRLYINRSVVDAVTPNSGYTAWLLGRALSSISDPSATAAIATGQAYSTSFWNPLSRIIFNPTYSAFLGNFPDYNPENQPIELNLPVVGNLFSQPLWQSNGAWTNNVHNYAELAADLAVGSAGAAQIAIGIGLFGIPFVGFIIGTPFIVSGALMIRDAAQESQHLNTTYNNGSYRLGSEVQFGIPDVDPFGVPISGRTTIQVINAVDLLANAPYTLNFGNFSLQAGPLDADPTAAELVTALQSDTRYAAGPINIHADGNNLVVTTRGNGPVLELARISSGLTALVNFMDTQSPASAASSVGTWDAKRFLDFFEIPNDKFVPTLEVTSHPVKEGIYTIVSVYNGTETFVFLVASPDRMIQNNETLLIAQINGRVTADQIVLYDDSTEFAGINRYLNETPVTPVPAPKVASIVIQTDDDAIAPVSGKLLTVDRTPSILITFDKALESGDTVSVTYRGSAVTFTAPSAGATTLSLTLPSAADDGVYDLEVDISNAQGFTSNLRTEIGIDANPILAADLTLRGIETGVIFGFRANTNPDGQASNGASPETATAKITLANGTDLSADLTEANGYNPTLVVSAQSSVQQGDLSVTDAYGRKTDLTAYSATLGTTGNDSFTGVSGVQNFLYGFDGNDSITGAGLADVLSGDAGNDTLNGAGGNDYLFGSSGDDQLNGGTGNDQLTGGAGDDVLTGGSGIDTFTFAASGSANGSDSITDFTAGAGGDVLDVSAFLPGVVFDPILRQIETAGQFGSTGNITGKIVQLWSIAADSSAAVSTAADIMRSFNDLTFRLDVGGKAILISGEDTSSQPAYMWFINDANNNGIDIGDISLVATFSSIQLSTLVAGNIFA